MKNRFWLATAALLSQAITPVLAESTPSAPAAAPAPPPVDAGKQPSLHLRCDGNPATMSGGESFARFVGAVTLLGLFAPRPETPNPGARLFGDAGIAACSALIDGPHPDGNSLRRLQLILARAIHHMEMKDYPASLADVEKARGEAKTLGLIGNPYFDQSLGLSFDVLTAQNAYLMGDGEKARDYGLRNAAHAPYSYMPMITQIGFYDVNRTGSAAEDAVLRARDRVLPQQAAQHAARLEELGRFAEAAQLRDAGAALVQTLNSEFSPASHHALGAISWALAGDWDKAEWRAKAAREEIDQLDAAGKPFAYRANVIEALDFFAVLKAAHQGHVEEARRNFAARSEWTAVSFGANIATTRLLRQGAKPEELTGALARTEDSLWQARHEKSLAVLLNMIAEGKREFGNILPFAKINEYEMVSRKVWKADRNGVISAAPDKNSRFFHLSPQALEPIYRIVAPDAVLLNAALIAKARGFKGFVFFGTTTLMTQSFVEFGNPGEQDMIDPFYVDADSVIAQLRPLMPSPEELAAREKAVKT
jgi:hypothetical protein